MLRFFIQGITETYIFPYNQTNHKVIVMTWIRGLEQQSNAQAVKSPREFVKCLKALLKQGTHNRLLLWCLNGDDSMIVTLVILIQPKTFQY